jgi:hypothetical protein
MSQVEFKPAIPVFERSETVWVSDGTATKIDYNLIQNQ